MELIEASITRYLSALDMADQEDAATVPNKPGKLKEKIAALRKRMEQLKPDLNSDFQKAQPGQ
jgi:hypothetical protein